MNSLDQQHKSWLEVTATALSELHRTDGFKGSKEVFQAQTKYKEQGDAKSRRTNRVKS